ncbi:metallophosphoesterase [Caudoviricetes sp.]|nr:metallophosphoesterase [Caudoviricetes sp.]
MPRTYIPWTDAETEMAQNYAREGLNVRQIAERLGSHRTGHAVGQHLANVGTPWMSLASAAALPPVIGPRSEMPESPYSDDIPAWLDALRPVQLPAPSPAVTVQTAGDFTIVASDFHFPQQCDRSVSILLETIRQLRPKRLVLNGDTVDLLAVSKYPKDQRHVWSLREEVAAFHAFLHQAMSLGNAWGMTILETEANHSGNGTASRWHRYLSDRVPHLYNHPEAQRLLSYETWFYPEWCPIALVDSLVIADDLLVIHGDLVRKHGAYSARGHMEKWHSSVMHGHTHRVGQSVRRIPAMGTRAEALQRAYEAGCMCSLTPSYVSAPDWANGFAIVSHDPQELDYGVELVTIQRGQAVVTALGQTVRAA